MTPIKDRIAWISLLKEEFSEYNDIYFGYEYFELYKRHYGGEPEAIFWKDKNIKIFWTHLIRDISKIEQFKDFKYYDLTTPYGYGGPLIITKTGYKKDIDNFIKIYYHTMEYIERTIESMSYAIAPFIVVSKK